MAFNFGANDAFTYLTLGEFTISLSGEHARLGTCTVKYLPPRNTRPSLKFYFGGR